jgi:hypothetical protein
MVTKTTNTKKGEILEEQSREKLANGRQEQLDRELEETFPASDPPSVTQPGVKPGAPEREFQRNKLQRSR